MAPKSMQSQTHSNKVLYPKKSHCIEHKLAEAIIKQTPLLCLSLLSRKANTF